MLSSLCQALTSAGCDVTALVGSGVPQAETALSSAGVRWEKVELDAANPQMLANSVTQKGRYDAVCLIAPELQGALAHWIHTLHRAGVPLLNCSGDFLHNTSDKWRTSCLLHQHGFPHPPTKLLGRVTARWINQVQQQWGNASWVGKPRDGAGGEQLEIWSTDELLAHLKNGEGEGTASPAGMNATERSETTGDPLIVQPFVAGMAASCCGLVDRYGRCYWLPPLQQQLVEANGRLHYRGGAPLDLARKQVTELHRLLDQAMRVLGQKAFGWIGVDLVYRPTPPHWTIIEWNPRATSSLIGWQRAEPVAVGQLFRMALSRDGFPSTTRGATVRSPLRPVTFEL